MIMSVIKRIVFAICLLYTVNIFITKMGKMVPINVYTIIIAYFFDFFGIIAIIYLKYYC